MTMTLNELAKQLHADINGPWLNVRAPGHSTSDRSLGIRFDPSAPHGFRISSLAGDDPVVCRKHVLKLLAKVASGGAIEIEMQETLATDAGQRERIARALLIWEAAQPVVPKQCLTYLAARGISISFETFAPGVLRFHPTCPMGGGSSVPAMVARVNDVITGEFSGIHRTALSDDFSVKRVMPDNRPSRMVMGVAKGSAVQLFACSKHLGIAEGVETALSAHRIFKMPVWAAMSASGIRDFPVIHGVTFLRIFADHDNAGRSAARMCKRRYEAAGTIVEIRYPPEPNSDWNDFLIKEIRK
jgi:hypothetical protein